MSMTPMWKKFTDEEFKQTVLNSNSMKEVMYGLGYKASTGRSRGPVKQRILELGLDGYILTAFILALPANEIAAECKNERGANMVVLGCLAKVIPGMVNVKSFEFALDEAISARNKKFNPINIATIEAAFNKDYEIVG